MTKAILKSVAIGILLGAAVFFIPKFLLGLLIILVLVRLIVGRRMGGGFRAGKFGGSRFAFADKVRSMSEEEYNQFKSNFQNSCHGKTKPVVN